MFIVVRFNKLIFYFIEKFRVNGIFKCECRMWENRECVYVNSKSCYYFFRN